MELLLISKNHKLPEELKKVNGLEEEFNKIIKKINEGTLEKPEGKIILTRIGEEIYFFILCINEEGLIDPLLLRNGLMEFYELVLDYQLTHLTVNSKYNDLTKEMLDGLFLNQILKLIIKII